jgi:hypothetical protein
MGDVVQPDDVLDVKRTVEAELLVDLGDGFRVAVLAQHGLRWISKKTPIVTRNATGAIRSRRRRT